MMIMLNRYMIGMAIIMGLFNMVIFVMLCSMVIIMGLFRIAVTMGLFSIIIFLVLFCMAVFVRLIHLLLTRGTKRKARSKLNLGTTGHFHHAHSTKLIRVYIETFFTFQL